MAPAKKAAAKKTPAKKKAAAKKAPAKKAAAKKKAPAKKAAAKKSPAKKKAAAKRAPAKKAAAPEAAPTAAAPPPAPAAAAAAPPPEPAGAAPVDAAPVQQQTVTVTSWNPSSGRGTVNVDDTDVPFDVTKAQVLNKGYVDLYVGQEVGVVVHEDGSDVESLEAF
jgi:cold shock CspA family protein